MASGQEHDKATLRWCIPFGILISLVFDLQSGFISGLAFLIGGLWLSPDLDTKSIPTKRWGIFQLLWRPYRTFIPHRSIFSHGPFIGTLIRLFYISTIILSIIVLFKPLDVIQTRQLFTLLVSLIKQYPQQSISLILGLEASVWLHLIKDGDPLPSEWHKIKHK